MNRTRLRCSLLVGVVLASLLEACSSSDSAPDSSLAGSPSFAGAGTSAAGSNVGSAGRGTSGAGSSAGGTSAVGSSGAGNSGAGDLGAGQSTGGSSAAGNVGAGSVAGGGASTSGGAGTSAGGMNSGLAGAAGTGDAEPATQTGMTAAHNAARANVNPAATPALPPLSWSNTLAATAQAWADGCQFKHSSGKYGENLYASAGSATTPKAVVDSWVSEAKDYDYASNSCTSVCGHYTQVVWRKSAKLGCAMTSCTKNSPFAGFTQWQLWVCNYDPPGNYVGQKPY